MKKITVNSALWSGTLFVMILLMGGCLSLGNPAASSEAGSSGSSAGGQKTASSGGSTESSTLQAVSEDLSLEETQKIEERLQGARQKQRYGDLAFALQSYAEVIQQLKGVSQPGAADLRRQALQWMKEAEKNMTLIVEQDWLDDQGSQKTPTLDALINGSSLLPSVVLTTDNGRFAVADIPIHFYTLRGEARTSPYVLTDSGGKARCPVSGVSPETEELVIRSVVEFQTPHGAYTLEDVFLDFTYLPSNNQILFLHGAWREEAPVNASVVANALGEAASLDDWDLSFIESPTQADRILQAFQGDPDALEGIGQGMGGTYALIVVSRINEVRQVSYQGQSFQLYTALAESSLRLIRISDGAVIQTYDVESTQQGQGGTPDLAVSEAWKALAQKWKEEGAALNKSLQEALEGLNG